MSKNVDKAELERIQVKSLQNTAHLINGFKNISNTEALSSDEFEIVKRSLLDSNKTIYFLDNEINEYLESISSIKNLYKNGLITNEEFDLIKKQLLSQITFASTLAKEYITRVNRGFILLESKVFSNSDFVKAKEMALYRSQPEILDSYILDKPIYAFIELLYNSGYRATTSSIKPNDIRIIMTHPTYSCNPIYIKRRKSWFTGCYSRKVKDKQGNKFKDLSILDSYLKSLKL